MKFDDPWESIPADKRLEFAVIREPLRDLAAATIENVRRALPAEINKVPGTLALLLPLTCLAEAMFNTIGYFCADTPEDPRRRVSFSSSAPPLLRAMLDEIYTVVFIGEDLAPRVSWYYKAGWREMREEYDRYVQRYQGKPDWDPWLAAYGKSLKSVEAESGITSQEVANPGTIPRWPTPLQMLQSKILGPDSQKFLEFMRDWFYREFSQDDHLSLPGLIRRGSVFLRPQGDELTLNIWKKLRSDWVTYAIVLYLAAMTEIVLLCGFEFRAKCGFVWGIIKEYSPMAAEVYAERYEKKLAG